MRAPHTTGVTISTRLISRNSPLGLSASCLTESLTHRFPEPPTALAPRQVGPASVFSHSHAQRFHAGWDSIGTACNSQDHNDTEEIKVIPMKGLGKQNITGHQSWEGQVLQVTFPIILKGLKDLVICLRSQAGLPAPCGSHKARLPCRGPKKFSLPSNSAAHHRGSTALPGFLGSKGIQSQNPQETTALGPPSPSQNRAWLPLSEHSWSSPLVGRC